MKNLSQHPRTMIFTCKIVVLLARLCLEINIDQSIHHRRFDFVSSFEYRYWHNEKMHFTQRKPEIDEDDAFLTRVAKKNPLIHWSTRVLSINPLRSMSILNSSFSFSGSCSFSCRSPLLRVCVSPSRFYSLSITLRMSSGLRSCSIVYFLFSSFLSSSLNINLV